MTSTPVNATENDDPLWSTPPGRRPWRGIALLGTSVVSTLAVLIFFGAWLADDRIEARAGESGQQASGEWWEDGLIAVCPIH